MKPLDQVQRQRDAAAAHVGQFEASLTALARQVEPEDFEAALALRDRRAQAEARLEFARERLKQADMALASAQEAARRQSLLSEKTRLEREGDKRAATWQPRWEKAGAELLAIMEERAADKRACALLSDQLREIGSVGLWDAEQRLRHRLGLDHGDLESLHLPAFEQRRGRLYPRPAAGPVVAF